MSASHPHGIYPLGRCFDDKARARTAVWRVLSDSKVARFPFPIEGRIPNFAGADAAAARLLSHQALRTGLAVKALSTFLKHALNKAVADYTSLSTVASKIATRWT